MRQSIRTKEEFEEFQKFKENPQPENEALKINLREDEVESN